MGSDGLYSSAGPEPFNDMRATTAAQSGADVHEETGTPGAPERETLFASDEDLGTSLGSVGSTQSLEASVERLESVARAIQEFDRDVEDRARRASRPSPVGLAFRKIVGVDERLMDAFFAERAKYTAMGGFIVGTATLASVSMWFAVYDGLHAPIAAAIVVAIVWGFFIGNMDRWLVASLSKPGWGRFAIVFPRLLFAVLFAVIIAEPITLRIFDDEIRNHLAQSRSADLTKFTDLVTRCNPQVPRLDPSAIPSECVGATLPVEGAPAGALQKIQALQLQATTAETKLEKDSAELKRQQDLARDECNGVPGRGKSGQFGEGPNCRQDRLDAANFAAAADIPGQQRALAQIKSLIEQATAESGGALETYSANVNAAIKARIADYQTDQGKIGLLDKVKSLGDLMSNPFVWWSSWLVRLLFVVIECMPIIIKLLSGRGGYEEALQQRMELETRLEAERNSAIEAVRTLGPKIAVIRADSHLRSAESDQIARERFEMAHRRAHVVAEIRRYRDRLLMEGHSQPFESVDLREPPADSNRNGKVQRSNDVSDESRA